MTDVITITSSALPQANRVIGFHGSEGLSMPYSFAIDLLVGHDVELDMDAVLGQRLTLAFDRQDERPPFQFHGVIATLELVHELSQAGIYTLTLVPELWQLSLTRHSRVFVDETTPAILQAVLKANGLSATDYELRLTGTYKQLEHVCQYEESDLAFISRRMEREGIYYFFEQGSDRERLIVTDSLSHHQELLPQPIRYVAMASAGGLSRGEALDSLTCKHVRLPATVKLEDYDYNRPDLDVTGMADIGKNGIGEVRLFGENFSSSDEGKRLAKVRAQELSSRRAIYQGTGNALYLRSGYVFALEEHPRPAFNTRYLVTSIEHVANQAAHAMNVQDLLGYDRDDVYRCHVTAISASVQYRPERITPTPRVDGIVTATVDGPADSPYAQLDKDGRYKVRILFDEGEPQDGEASTRVRMLQPHGGSSEGFHFPLRKGTEVLLVFLGGDPDRPLIAGVAPNAHRPSMVTEENHTKNVIQTGGQNRIEMEDAEGSQHARISTPTENTFLHMGAPRDGRHFISKTEGSSLFHTTGSRKMVALNDVEDDVTGDVIEKYDCEQDTRVGGDRVETIHGNRFLTVHKEDTTTVMHDASVDYVQDVATHVGGIVVETYDHDHVTSVGGETKRSSDKKETIVVAERKETIVGDYNQNIGGKSVQTISGDSFRTIMGTNNDTFMSPASSMRLQTNNAIFIGAASNLTLALEGSIFVGGKMSYSASYEFSITAALKTSFTMSGSLEMEMGVKFSVAGAPVIEQKTISISTSGVTMIQ